MSGNSPNQISAPLVLASSSPRRLGFLKDLGYEFAIIAPQIDEVEEPGEKPVDFVKRMAREKSAWVASKHQPKAVILSADTIVRVPNNSGERVLGKPQNPDEAAAMLNMLSGSYHWVTTAYCLRHQSKALTRAVHTKVTFRALSARDIDRYIESGEPFDKAGSYGIQGLATHFIEEISGSYTNVAGLPTAALIKDLEKFNVHPKT